MNESQARSQALTKEGATGVISPDLSEIIGYEDIATAAAEMIRTPHAPLNFFLALTKDRSLSDPILRTMAFYLLCRFKLSLIFDSRYVDTLYVGALSSSSLINETFELLPVRYQERFEGAAPFAGFLQFIAACDISRIDNNATLTVLQSKTITADSRKRMAKVQVFQEALLLTLEDDPVTNENLRTLQVPSYERLKPEKRTEALILGLRDYFARGDYYGINYQQLLVLAECAAYVKRFYRERWRVEVEDVLEAWYIINYCKQPRAPLSPSLRTILTAIQALNRARIFPSQRQVIKKTGLANNTVSQAVGLKIKRWEGAGRLIVAGYVEYDDCRGGYRLTELGELALDNNFHITVGKENYVPKNPLES